MLYLFIQKSIEWDLLLAFQFIKTAVLDVVFCQPIVAHIDAAITLDKVVG